MGLPKAFLMLRRWNAIHFLFLFAVVLLVVGSFVTIKRTGFGLHEWLSIDIASSLWGTEAGEKEQEKTPLPAWKDEITAQFLKQMDEVPECLNYLDYSKKTHDPLSQGEHKYPFMRPPPKCRTFTSSAVEKVIKDLKSKIEDPDLARLVENCLPNTLDTTILWHTPSRYEGKPKKLVSHPESFIVTGDIHAEWLRDSARQLSVYQPMVKYDNKLKDLIKGAIRTQEKYILNSPYCNAFHPPPASKVKKGNTAMDLVFPTPDWTQVFECKYEIDSLASFLTLTNEYLENSDGDLSIITDSWIKAYENVLTVLRRETQPLFDPVTGQALSFFYSFQRQTNIGSETLPLGGVGNPVNFETGLVRSAFRPSDDATVMQFFVPGNAHMLTELKKLMKNVFNRDEFKSQVQVHRKYTESFIANITQGIKDYGIVDHHKWGKVYAFEVDGYGGNVIMDDANIPSLLSLPDLGFLDVRDKVYQATRKMILSKAGNPYFLTGDNFEGIGGPHIGIQNAWPMSLLMRIRTTDSEEEIKKSLKFVMDTTAGLGLMHESVNVNSKNGKDYTRPWFAWCNSEFGKTILHLAKHKPHLIFKAEYATTPYSIDAVLSG